MQNSRNTKSRISVMPCLFNLEISGPIAVSLVLLGSPSECLLLVMADWTEHLLLGATTSKFSGFDAEAKASSWVWLRLDPWCSSTKERVIGAGDERITIVICANIVTVYAINFICGHSSGWLECWICQMCFWHFLICLLFIKKYLNIWILIKMPYNQRIII